MGAAEQRRYHHGDLRTALLSEAAALLERDGPEAISFRAIARAVGVSQTAPYNHFADREALLAVLAEEGLRTLASSQQAAAQAAPPGAARVAALGRDYVAFAIAHPQRYRLMFGVGIADWSAHPPVAEAKRASFAPIREAVDEPAGPADVETAAVTAWALVHGLSMLLLDRALGTRTDDEARALTEDVLRTLTSGLRPRNGA